MHPRIHFTVAAVIHRNGRYLMVTEIIDGLQVLNQPAGHVEPGESVLEAVRRETLEETCWQVEPVACLGLGYYAAPSGDSFHRVTLVCDPLIEVVATPDADIESRLWLSAAEILGDRYRHRSPMVRAAIRDHQAGVRYSLAMLRDYR